MAEEVTLPEVASERDQPLALLLGLDALGRDLDPERLGHGDDGADDRLTPRIAEAGDE
jgi:hypothetical protein